MIDQTRLGANARTVVAKRYARKDEHGRPLETWDDICRRVASHVAEVETDPAARESFFRRALDLLLERKFLPNTPCLINAGRPNAQLAACFVLPVHDSIADIMEHAKQCALIHQSGGGTGMSYEGLRPAGALVNSTRGVASGPVSFMNIVNTVTETIKQGGLRKGANMGILSVEHPDVLRFIHAKNDQTSLTNFNISVTVTDRFLDAVERGEWHQTRFDGEAWTEPVFDPLTGKEYEYQGRPAPRPGMVFAPDVWRRMVESAWKHAEPGIILIDQVNRANHLTATLGRIYASNPCGEQLLHAYNACNLGSIDVSKFTTDEGVVRWDELREAVRVGVRFLDNVVDACAWPLPEIEAMVKRTRPIGLGVMGVADVFLKMRIRYGSPQSLKVAEEVMRFFRLEAWKTSRDLGREKGVFPEFEGNRAAYESFFASLDGFEGKPTPRNYEVTTIAPTGTISLVAECSSGIEPNFGWAYVREDTLGKRVYVHPAAARALGVEYDPNDLASIERAAEFVVRNAERLPEWFVSAHAIIAEEHVRVLAAFQKHTDNSISKTVNGAATDTVDDVDRLFRTAQALGVKCVSYYRDGSRDGQVLTAVAPTEKTETAAPPPEPEPTAHGRKTERPRELPGWTWQVPIEGQNLYVTVNYLDKRVIEVFAVGPISNSVGRLASQMLRTCFAVDDVARILSKVNGTHTIWFNRQCLTSSEQVIAACLRIAQRRLEGRSDALDKPGDAVPTKKSCRACGGPVVRLNNCDVCVECGNSKCG